MTQHPAGPPQQVPHGHMVPRFAGLASFARLPYSQSLEGVEVAIFGVPFDGGTTFRPGARFGPQGIRQSSRLLRAYNYALDVRPFEDLSLVDYGDLAVVPTDIEDTYSLVERQAGEFYAAGTFPLALGGDHSVTLPLPRELKGLPMVAADLVEVAPNYDQSEITSMLAANLVYEMLSLIAWKKTKL